MAGGVDCHSGGGRANRLPAVAPVLIGATRAVEAALGTAGASVSDGWPWVGLLTVFAVALGVGGSLAFGPLVDE